jgi:CRP/FNR family transcriptional regulator, cyclic AMP receptor protein
MVSAARDQPTVAMLKEVKLFSAFSDAELQQLTQLGSSTSCDPHANIVIEGELSWGLYVLLEGLVGVYKTNKMSGDVYDVGQMRTGAFFGEMSLLDDNPRSATVRSLTDCQLFFISKDDFISFLNASMDRKLRFFENCVRDLVGRLRELDENYVISQFQLWKTAINRKGAA